MVFSLLYSHKAAPVFLCSRVEDHDDILPIIEEQSDLLSLSDRPYYIVDVIESQNEHFLVAVCEVRSNFFLTDLIFCRSER